MMQRLCPITATINWLPSLLNTCTISPKTPQMILVAYVQMIYTVVRIVVRAASGYGKFCKFEYIKNPLG
jgi:hypothetical protein